MERIGGQAHARRIADLPTGIQRCLEVADRRGVGKIALVVLNHEGHARKVVPIFRHVVVQVLHRFLIRFHALDLRIGDENDAVDALENELTARVVVDLAGNGIEMEARLEPANRAEIDGEEIEEESALRLRRERDEFSSRVGRDFAVDVLEVRRLAAQPRRMVDDFDVTLARGVVDHRHAVMLRYGNSLAISSPAPARMLGYKPTPAPRLNTPSNHFASSSTVALI